MILKKLQNQITSEKKTGFVLPRYRDYCFSNIPATIFSLLGIHQKRDPLKELWKNKIRPENRNKIVLILIDGFGYNQWLTHRKKFKFLDNFTRHGTVAPVTTVFPSTTSATLTTIHSGTTPKQHALIEWWLYLREIDKIIVSLPFSAIGEYGRDTLLKHGVNPKVLFSGRTIYKKLKRQNIQSFAFTRGAYIQSVYSKLIHSGSAAIPYTNASDLMVNLRNKIKETRGPAYFYVYWDTLDSLSHAYGPGGEHYSAELNSFTYLLQKEFIEKIDKRAAAETTLIVTADHGQIDVSGKKTIYLNRYKKLADSFQISPQGNKILPWGSPRDLYLQIKKEKLGEIFEYLKKILAGKAEILFTADAVEKNLFGYGKPHAEFYNRTGNIMILPAGNYTIWYEHIKGNKFHLTGMHGGLSPGEMIIPFAFANLSDLT